MHVTQNTVYQNGNLSVKVDLTPIGGFRGKAGALTIDHDLNRIFTDWEENDLSTLADMINRILIIHERAGIFNTLIIGRQEGTGQFKLSLIPYPKCNWIEKIQGFIHVFFSPPSLTKLQAKEITQFYLGEFLTAPTTFPTHTNRASQQISRDPFCNPAILQEQEIKRIDSGLSGKGEYHLLHDKWPKGVAPDDPHFLIVPEGSGGHCDGSKVPHEMRSDMLKISQKAMRILISEKKFSTLFFIERNGDKLASAQHKHTHVNGVQNFPKSFLKKIFAMIWNFFPQALSNLKGRIMHYRQFDWSID